MALLVIYEARGVNSDPAGVRAVLEAHPGWWHHLESTWILATPATPEGLWTVLEPLLDDDDRVLILEIGDVRRQGWLSSDAWGWLERHLPLGIGPPVG